MTQSTSKKSTISARNLVNQKTKQNQKRKSQPLRVSIIQSDPKYNNWIGNAHVSCGLQRDVWMFLWVWVCGEWLLYASE